MVFGAEERMFVLEPKCGTVSALAFGPDSRTLAGVCDTSSLLLWSDPISGDKPRKIRTPTPSAGPVRFSLDGKRLECRTTGALFVLDPAGADEPVAVARPPWFFLHHFQAALTPDGQAVLISYKIGPEEGTHRSRLELRPQSAPPEVISTWSLIVPRVIWDDALFLPDGRTAVILERGHVARSRWDLFLVARELATGRELWTSALGEEAPHSAILSADGRLVAAWHARYLVAWRTDDQEHPPIRIKNDGTKHFTGLAFHPSGRFLAATSNDTTVKLYDTTTWQVATSFAWQIGRLRCVAFSPDGCRAAVGSDKGRILIWDVDL
jgi:WD40 repeat protein